MDFVLFCFAFGQFLLIKHFFNQPNTKESALRSSRSSFPETCHLSENYEINENVNLLNTGVGT